jgi:hypothetical protein
MSDQVLSALKHFFTRWQRDGEARRGLPLCQWESEWRSPCQLGEPVDGQISWRPHLRSEPGDFTAMNEVVAYLTENCCGQGAVCAPACCPEQSAAVPTDRRTA